MEAVTDSIFLSSKITADSDCSCEIKRCLLLGRKTMTNLDNILKTRHHLLTKVNKVKGMVFPTFMYRYEIWTIRKAEHQRIDAFELWYWRRLLTVSWAARRSNQSVLKKTTLNIHWKDWCWSGSSKTCHLLQRADYRKDPDAGKDQRQKKKQVTEDEIDSITDSIDMNLSKPCKIMDDWAAWQAAVHGVAKSQIWLSDWATKEIHR